MSITVDGTPPPGFTPGSPTDYKAASGPYTFTCTVTGGAETGDYGYMWTSTSLGSDFKTSSAESTKVITRQTLHSGDGGIHTCTASKTGGQSGNASINVTIVGEYYCQLAKLPYVGGCMFVYGIVTVNLYYGFHKKPTKQDGTHMTIRSQISIPTSIFPTTPTIIPYSLFWNGCVYLCVVNSRIGLWGLWVGVCIEGSRE